MRRIKIKRQTNKTLEQEASARKEIIKRYFNSWINKDINIIERHFSQNIKYVECYGPEYNGKERIIQWFNDWQKENNVLQWNMKRFFNRNNVIIAEWFFECETKTNKHSFDGVSIIEFDGDKITMIKEFQSKSEHYFPYKNN
jgi:ketosteroid isomerase-like protein